MDGLKQEYPSSSTTYIETGQVRADIGPYFAIIDLIPAVLCMLPHGASAIAFVVVMRALLGGESKAADCTLEDGCRLHFDGYVDAAREKSVDTRK